MFEHILQQDIQASQIIVGEGTKPKWGRRHKHSGKNLKKKNRGKDRIAKITTKKKVYCLKIMDYEL